MTAWLSYGKRYGLGFDQPPGRDRPSFFQNTSVLFWLFYEDRPSQTMRGCWGRDARALTRHRKPYQGVWLRKLGPGRPDPSPASRPIAGAPACLCAVRLAREQAPPPKAASIARAGRRLFEHCPCRRCGGRKATKWNLAVLECGTWRPLRLCVTENARRETTTPDIRRMRMPGHAARQEELQAYITGDSCFDPLLAARLRGPRRSTQQARKR
jgi:hypothetical protein